MGLLEFSLNPDACHGLLAQPTNGFRTWKNTTCIESFVPGRNPRDRYVRTLMPY